MWLTTCRSLAYGELPKSERKLLREELFGVGDRADSPRTAPFAEFRIYYKDGRESRSFSPVSTRVSAILPPDLRSR